jgi:hypothetical protein
MGKHKTSNKQVKNIFKVAGAKSLKSKNKAKAVSVQLKKVSHERILQNMRSIFFSVLPHLFCLFLCLFYLYFSWKELASSDMYSAEFV